MQRCQREECKVFWPPSINGGLIIRTVLTVPSSKLSQKKNSLFLNPIVQDDSFCLPEWFLPISITIKKHIVSLECYSLCWYFQEQKKFLLLIAGKKDVTGVWNVPSWKSANSTYVAVTCLTSGLDDNATMTRERYNFSTTSLKWRPSGPQWFFSNENVCAVTPIVQQVTCFGNEQR